MDILGIGYLGFESPNPQAWSTYGPEVLALGLAPAPEEDPETVRLRMDDRAYRIAVHRGPIDRLAYIGWELTGRRAYNAAVETLHREGIKAETGDPSLRRTRCVRELTIFTDPAGYRHEIFYGQKSDPKSFVAGRSHGGFVADALGVGHVVLSTPVYDAVLERFYFDVMGFEWFGSGVGEHKMGFFRPPLNRRSHCVGFVLVPNHVGIHHLGLPVRELDDVGIAYDIVQKRQIPLQRTLGRHTQDPVVSFYHFTPSGFPVEYFHEIGSWDQGGEVNPEQLSLWGHDMVGAPFGTTIRPLDSAAN